MRAAGATEAAIVAFRHAYERLTAGDLGMIPEAALEPVAALPRLEDFKDNSHAAGLLSRTVVIKLNGGLGTSMGLERAKSLLEVKPGLSFLDLIARQVIHLKRTMSPALRFMLMNSFNTSADTLAALRAYPGLGDPARLELIQNQAPKVDAKTLRPAEWQKNPTLEWCPPGHGDIYPCLLGSGWLDRLLADGVIYAFVSNSDNLGATLDPRVLEYFAKSDHPFLMEVAERTEMDRKGGHLARRDGRFVLRESAQCPEADLPAFQDTDRHRYFNTNNLWLRLDRLAALLKEHDGLVSLPLIRNQKTVDPRDKHSPAVLQLETAMGAAIQAFPDSGALVVPRSRFVPVKTTSDLLVLRSDFYELKEDGTVAAVNMGVPPVVELDAQHYKLITELDRMVGSNNVPSLSHCRRLTIKGPVQFTDGIRFEGEVLVENRENTAKPLPAGSYANRAIVL